MSHHGTIPLPFPEVVAIEAERDSALAAGRLIFAYGGGVNTVAGLIHCRRAGIRPLAILMADPGDEKTAVLRYRDEVMRPWCAANGFPDITTVARKDEGQHRPRAWRLETLYEECYRIKALPSVAYGHKKCSQKYKGETSRWWVARQPWAQEIWSSGLRIAKAIGYDVDEGKRVRKAFQNPWEEKRLFPAGLGRDEPEMPCECAL